MEAWMIVEILKYHALPGKLEEIKNWFGEVGIKFFAEYRIEQLGFWTYLDQSRNTLVCLLRWNTLAEREVKWTRLESDRLWQSEQATNARLIRLVETTLLSAEMDLQ
jgi:hypothetical protein